MSDRDAQALVREKLAKGERRRAGRVVEQGVGGGRSQSGREGGQGGGEAGRDGGAGPGEPGTPFSRISWVLGHIA